MGNLFLLKRKIVCDRIALQKVPMTGWLPSKLIPPENWRVHKKGGDANDRL